MAKNGTSIVKCVLARVAFVPAEKKVTPIWYSVQYAAPVKNLLPLPRLEFSRKASYVRQAGRALRYSRYRRGHVFLSSV